MTRLTVAIDLRWSDLDAYGHVNNATMLRLLEEVRVRAFWRLGGDAEPATAVIAAAADGDSLTLIASHRIEYLRPLEYRKEPIRVELWMSKLGGASLEASYEVLGAVGDDTVYARASTVIVFLDAATGRPRRLRDDEIAAWSPYREAPISFRGSGGNE